MPAVVWKGFISFGLVSFPVRLYSAGRADPVRFHMLHRKDNSRVREVWYCAEEDKPIDRSEIVKGYEAGKGEYVVVEEEELKKIEPPTASTMEIVQFVRQNEVDPIYFENSYYVGPDEAVSKPYALFLQALAHTKHFAIAKLAMHRREHIVLIRPYEGAMVLHTLFYPRELREANRPELKSTSKPTAKELELARNLVEQLAGPFKPSDFHDAYRENVERLIQEKERGEKVTVAPKAKKAPVIDLMEALKRSLETRPSGRKPSTQAASRGRKGSGKRKAA